MGAGTMISVGAVNKIGFHVHAFASLFAGLSDGVLSVRPTMSLLHELTNSTNAETTIAAKKINFFILNIFSRFCFG